MHIATLRRVGEKGTCVTLSPRVAEKLQIREGIRLAVTARKGHLHFGRRWAGLDPKNIETNSSHARPGVYFVTISKQGGSMRASIPLGAMKASGLAAPCQVNLSIGKRSIEITPIDETITIDKLLKNMEAIA